MNNSNLSKHALRESYEKQVAAWQTYAASHGISKSICNPPLDRILRKLGFTFRPAVFWSPLIAATVMGTYFAVVWGVAMHFIAWGDRALSLQLITSIVAGLTFGVVMAAINAIVRKRRKIPAWDTFRSRGIE
jgi:Family of unknown function (DUF6404)